MATSLPMSSSHQPRRYRLVDHHGQPHLELDQDFESLEEAWDFASQWCNTIGGLADGSGANNPIGLGVEVSTESGHWRTLRHPQG
ncbi:hypothetical protein [Synechococcus sp. RedBA-s]|uniref:hypothetical protein n=1 Tax=Synechococcus sp. RedBA-s TaxID=2823741 RepID=UPI0020CF80AE|nr:hypothetical protein [Synechococcus sp. RedBA-s]MCP9801863.1 hypothetical protein [Synechococcus sp. RedBA-s]